MARVLGSAPMGLHPLSTTGLATPKQKNDPRAVTSTASQPMRRHHFWAGWTPPFRRRRGLPPSRPWCSLATPGGLEDARPTEAGPPGETLYHYSIV